jgi:hypothetical protein
MDHGDAGLLAFSTFAIPLLKLSEAKLESRRLVLHP